MYLNPLLAKLRDVRSQIPLDAAYVLCAEPVAFAQFGWPFGAVQQKHSLAPAPSDMHMRWPVVVRIDRHPEAIEAENSRHGTI